MNDLQVFDNPEFGNIRTTEIDGKPYFCAADIAEALGYFNTRDAISKHCKGVVKRDTLTPGGIQALNFIPEGDIYRLIVRSKLPSAEQFERWVFDEVIPSIRETGGYHLPQTYAEALRALADKSEQAEKLTARVEEMRPKEIFADAVSASSDSILIGELAEILTQNGYRIGQNRLFSWLRENGYLQKIGEKRNLPAQKYIEMGIFKIKKDTVTKSDGTILVTRTPKVTGKGQLYFINKFTGGRTHERQTDISNRSM